MTDETPARWQVNDPRVAFCMSKPEFTEHQIRRALLGFCGANPNALLHYLAFSAAVENEAALNSGQVPDDFTTEYLVELQAAIMKWLDNDDEP